MHFPKEEPAKLHYKSGEYEVLHPGSYVLCAVTRDKIPLESLTYWSYSKQEAYSSAEVSYKRFLETEKTKKALL